MKERVDKDVKHFKDICKGSEAIEAAKLLTEFNHAYDGAYLVSRNDEDGIVAVLLVKKNKSIRSLAKRLVGMIYELYPYDHFTPSIEKASAAEDYDFTISFTGEDYKDSYTLYLTETWTY